VPQLEALGDIAVLTGFGSQNKSSFGSWAFRHRKSQCPFGLGTFSKLVYSGGVENLARPSWYRVVVLHGIARVLEEGVIINTRYLYGKQAGANNRDIVLIRIPLFEGYSR
jgi:hypothetical protein